MSIVLFTTYTVATGIGKWSKLQMLTVIVRVAAESNTMSSFYVAKTSTIQNMITSKIQSIFPCFFSDFFLSKFYENLTITLWVALLTNDETNVAKKITGTQWHSNASAAVFATACAVYGIVGQFLINRYARKSGRHLITTFLQT